MILLLDGGDHRAAAQLLHVVEHVVDTALEVHHELVRIHTELVHEGIVHGLRTVLGEHQVVGRGSRLLVGITADQVLGVRGALDEVGHGVDVDELLLGEIPAVDDEVDVEPDLGNFRDVDGLLDFLDLGDDLVHHFLLVLIDANALGETPLAVLLADVPGQAEGGAEVGVDLVVLEPVGAVGLEDAGFTVEVVGEEGAADVEQEVEAFGQAELVHETGVEGGTGGVVVQGGAVGDTATGIGVDVKDAIRLVTAEDVHQVRVREGVQIKEHTLLDSELVDIPLGIARRIPGNILLVPRTEETLRAVITSRRIALALRIMLGIGLIQALELAGGESETHTEARGSPLREIHVDSREGDHFGPILDLPVVVTVIAVQAETGAQLPVVPETVRENRVLLEHGRRGDLAVGGNGLLDDRLRLLILALGDLGTLGKNGCRGQDAGRCDQEQNFFHMS